MRALLRLHRTLLPISLAVMLQYRAASAIWMIGAVVEPLIFLSVWSVAARSAGGTVGGMHPEDLAAYYVVLLAVNHLTFSWITEVFQYRIQFGSLSFELLRPVHPIHGDISDNLAYKLVMLAVVLPAVAMGAFLFHPRFEPKPWSLAAAVVAVPLGFALRFTLDWSVALVAFWTTRIMAVNRIYYALLTFLSGRVAPIPLLPHPLGFAAQALPFYYGLGFSVELVLGHLTPGQAARGLALQAVWLLLAVALLTSIWRVAVRRFTAVGG